MKISTNFFSTIISFLILFACNSSETKTKLSLNDGKKWEVNAEMKPHVQNEIDLLATFLGQKDTDYKKLATALAQENDLLVQSCTMKGESHDELHKWLHPHMVLIKELGDSKNYADAEIIIEKLENSFQTYQSYFD